MTVLSADDVTLLRKKPHYVKWGLSIYIPSSVLSGTVAGLRYGARSIPFTMGSFDPDYVSTNFSYLTCYVYNTSGDKIGSVRVRHANWITVTSDVGGVITTSYTDVLMVVAENNIDWTQATHFSVMSICEPWAVWPRITYDNNHNPTYYRDYDIAYTNQNVVLTPIPMMGPNLAGDIVRSGDSVTNTNYTGSTGGSGSFMGSITLTWDDTVGFTPGSVSTSQDSVGFTSMGSGGLLGLTFYYQDGTNLSTDVQNVGGLQTVVFYPPSGGYGKTYLKVTISYLQPDNSLPFWSWSISDLFMTVAPGGTISFYFDASASYTLDGSFITNYDWVFHGADTPASNLMTPGWISWSKPGHFQVSLKITTNDDGYTSPEYIKTTMAYRHVSIYDPTDVVAPPVGNKPYYRWGTSGVSGDYGSGGWSTKIWMREDANPSIVCNDAIVVIYATETQYGNTTGFLGGNYPNREKIIYSGYIGNGSIDVDPVTSMVQFDVVSITTRLQSMECPALTIKSAIPIFAVQQWHANVVYSTGTDNTLEVFVQPTVSTLHIYKCLSGGRSGSSQPTWPVNGRMVTDGACLWQDCNTWYYHRELTVDKAVMFYLTWQTTVHQVSDVNKNGDTLGIKGQDFGKQSIYASIESLVQSALLAHFCSDRQGQIWLETKQNYLPVEKRTSDIVMGLNKADWRDRLSITQTRINPVAYVQITGVYYNNNSGAFEPFTSSAPSNLPEYIGSSQNMVGFAQESQDKSNILVGHVYADKNKTYPTVRVPLSGYYPVFDIAPQQQVLVSVSADDNYLGVSWSSKVFFVRNVNIGYNVDSKTSLVDITLEELTTGTPGQSGPYPPAAPDSPDNPPNPPPGPSPIPDSQYRVVAATDTYLAYTDNYADGSVWTKINHSITGTILDMELDKWDQNNQLWVSASSGIWRIKDYRNYNPDCVNVLSLDVFRTGTGTSKSIDRTRVGVTITADNVVYAHVLCTDGSVYVSYTNDDGDTWAFSSMLTVSTPGVEHGFAVSQHDYMKILSSGGNGKLWYSANSGGSWSNIYTVTGATVPIPNIEWPYADNSNDQIVYIGGK